MRRFERVVALPDPKILIFPCCINSFTQYIRRRPANRERVNDNHTTASKKRGFPKASNP